jgi:hypothetical protein
MDLPVMPVQFYRHKGMPGHIRWAVPATAQNWSFADIWVRRDIPRYFNDPEVLIRMFVFDVFVCNHDRHEGNILYTVSSTNGKHDLYLIDHDLALFGTERKWRRFSYDDPHWFEADRFLRLEEVQGLVHSFADLLPAIEMIEAISDEKIDSMVLGVRDLEELSYLDDREAHVIRSMLKLRKTRIELMLRKWCRDNGKA